MYLLTSRKLDRNCSVNSSKAVNNSLYLNGEDCHYLELDLANKLARLSLYVKIITR